MSDPQHQGYPLQQIYYFSVYLIRIPGRSSVLRIYIATLFMIINDINHNNSTIYIKNIIMNLVRELSQTITVFPRAVSSCCYLHLAHITIEIGRFGMKEIHQLVQGIQ